jgi:hypothetical protein
MPLFSEVHAPLWRGGAYVHAGQTSEGIAQLRAGIDTWRTLGGSLWTPYCKAVLANGIAPTGDIEQGLGLIEESLAQM